MLYMVIKNNKLVMVLEDDRDLAEGIELSLQSDQLNFVICETIAEARKALEHYSFDSGEVIIDGRNISGLSRDELTVYRRRKIGFVFQNYNLLPLMNVYENIVLPIKLDGIKPDDDYIEEILKLLKLKDKKYFMPNQLSGGQQQRVALARALAIKPAIILADEPTGNLDSRTSQDVLGLIKISSQNLAQTIVMITHNEEIAQMADRIIRIEDGKIVKGGE